LQTLDFWNLDWYGNWGQVKCNRDFTAARGWTAPRDPLVLDLDGDGIETVGINPLAPVLFDHDNDGVRTGTGWIKSDDGLLVLDRNGNGTIDGGAELFGDNTLGAAGTLAANGYIALQGQDSNGDNQINSQDASYNLLRIWRDLNQDGISQAGELQTLSQAGIASIGVAGTATNVNLGNGNTQVASGSFTRTNGTTGQSGAADITGSFLLAGNNFYSEFTDDPVLTAAAQALPQMQGSGWVRDLREAMSLSSPAAALLQQSVAAFAAGATRSAQLAQVDGLLESWARTTGAVLSDPTTRTVGDYILTLLPEGMTTSFYSSLLQKTVYVPTAAGAEFLEKLAYLQVFNGVEFFQLNLITSNAVAAGIGASTGGGGGGVGSVPAKPPFFVPVPISQTQVGFDQQKLG
jgi:hypothetical protein